MSTGDMSSGMPAGPAGCGGAVFAIVLVILLLIGSGAILWWILRDVGAI